MADNTAAKGPATSGAGGALSLDRVLIAALIVIIVAMLAYSLYASHYGPASPHNPATASQSTTVAQNYSQANTAATQPANVSASIFNAKPNGSAPPSPP